MIDIAEATRSLSYIIHFKTDGDQFRFIQSSANRLVSEVSRVPAHMDLETDRQKEDAIPEHR